MPTDDDDGCNHTTEGPLQNMITKEDEKPKKTIVDCTRVVQHVDFLFYGYSASSGSTADPDKHLAEAVSDFWLYLQFVFIGLMSDKNLYLISLKLYID